MHKNTDLTFKMLAVVDTSYLSCGPPGPVAPEIKRPDFQMWAREQRLKQSEVLPSIALATSAEILHPQRV